MGPQGDRWKTKTVNAVLEFSLFKKADVSIDNWNEISSFVSTSHLSFTLQSTQCSCQSHQNLSNAQSNAFCLVGVLGDLSLKAIPTFSNMSWFLVSMISLNPVSPLYLWLLLIKRLYFWVALKLLFHVILHIYHLYFSLAIFYLLIKYKQTELWGSKELWEW